ncbi:MAG: hypothetical protein ABEJ67_02375 [Halanaeroarchaeum sp.]
MADVSRGVSTVLGYTINLTVATLLISGLLFATGNLVEDQRRQAVRAEMTVVAERTVANLEAADRLSRAANNGHIRVHTALPRRLAGVGYRITIAVDGSNATAILATDDPSVRVTVPINNETAIQPTTVNGGSFIVTWNATEPLVVHDG